jgi:hypothetical protein
LTSESDGLCGQQAGHVARLPPLLRDFCRLTGLLSLASTLYCFIMWSCLHRQYPYDWPFFLPKERFGDFWVYERKFALFHHAAFFSTGFPFTYPAPVALLYKLFFMLGDTADLCFFLAFVCLAFLIPAALFGRALVKRGLRPRTSAMFVVVVAVLSWPAWLLFDRANVEIFVWVTLAIGTWAYARGKDWTAAAMFGLAASLKLFPFVYLALLLTRRGYKKLLFGLLTFVVLTVGSLSVLGPTIAVANRGISDGLKYFDANYVGTFKPDETGFDHSLFGFCKVIHGAVTGNNQPDELQRMSSVYLAAMALCGLLLYALFIRKLPWVNQLLALTIASILLTPFSGDGTLIHLYYPFAICCFLALDAWEMHYAIPGLRAILLCFAYLLSAESFFVFFGQRYEGQAKCFFLVVLMVLALKFPLHMSRDSACEV